MSRKIMTDALVTDDDFGAVKAAIARGDFKRIVYEMMSREPEIAFGVSEQFDHLLTLLMGVAMTDKQRQTIQSNLSLLAWSPVLALQRAHHRAWEDFLPSADDAKGGDA